MKVIFVLTILRVLDLTQTHTITINDHQKYIPFIYSTCQRYMLSCQPQLQQVPCVSQQNDESLRSFRRNKCKTWKEIKKILKIGEKIAVEYSHKSNKFTIYSKYKKTLLKIVRISKELFHFC